MKISFSIAATTVTLLLIGATSLAASPAVLRLANGTPSSVRITRSSPKSSSLATAGALPEQTSPTGVPAMASTNAPQAQHQHDRAEPRKVSIGNFTFSPATLEVPVGTTVLWVNEDDVPHLVIGTDAGSPLKSPALDTDGRYTAVLDRPGTYHYFCSLHPHMTGMVVVK